MREEMYMLWLSTVYGIGSRKQNLLLECFGSARAVFNAPKDMLRKTEGLTEHNVAQIIENRDLRHVEILLKKMELQCIGYLSRSHTDFPALLQTIPDPPVGLFYIGEPPDDTRSCVGIIGSPRCSEYGMTAARILSKPLARYDVAVVSGLARGVDSVAHKAAIEGGGRTFAVLGCGVDICYPAEHRALREDIIRNGCVLSEYPPGVKPIPAYFPARNRIISGLCSVVVVVEAARKSGTLITVEQALDQGRVVMAVPGSILSKLSEGTNQLINEGAAPVTCSEDILDVLGIKPMQPQQSTTLAAENTLAPDERIVYDSLTFEPISFEELLIKTNSQAHMIHYLCTMLELKGYIKKLPGLRYVRNVQ